MRLVTDETDTCECVSGGIPQVQQRRVSELQSCNFKATVAFDLESAVMSSYCNKP